MREERQLEEGDFEETDRQVGRNRMGKASKHGTNLSGLRHRKRLMPW